MQLQHHPGHGVRELTMRTFEEDIILVLFVGTVLLLLGLAIRSAVGC